MSVPSIIIKILESIRPLLVRIGTWIVEKVVTRGARAVSRFLTRRCKAMKRRAIRLADKMTKTRRHSAPALKELGRAAKQVDWLLQRRKNYEAMAQFLLLNASSLGRDISQRLFDFLLSTDIPYIGHDEEFEVWEKLRGM